VVTGLERFSLSDDGHNPPPSKTYASSNASYRNLRRVNARPANTNKDTTMTNANLHALFFSQRQLNLPPFPNEVRGPSI
jgi:hypothetical protein